MYPLGICDPDPIMLRSRQATGGWIMSDWHPEKLAQMVEQYLGHRFGAFLVRAAIICGALGVIAYGLVLFLDNLIGDVVWPFVVRIFGGSANGITLDNIEAVITTLIISLVLITTLYLILAFALLRANRRVHTPQYAIDRVAEFRSEGVSLLNDVPTNAAELITWKTKWTDWGAGATKYLEDKFTKSEALLFSRLGVIDVGTFSNAYNPEHNHYLMQLGKQLRTLENIVQSHLEKK